MFSEQMDKNQKTDVAIVADVRRQFFKERLKEALFCVFSGNSRVISSEKKTLTQVGIKFCILKDDF